MADCTGRPVQRPASGSTEVGGVTATPNIMCRWVDRSAAEEVRTVPNGKCFPVIGRSTVAVRSTHVVLTMYVLSCWYSTETRGEGSSMGGGGDTALGDRDPQLDITTKS